MPMTPSLTLYHFHGSLCSQKVRLALAEKAVPYEGRVVDIELRLQNYDPWYMRLNHRGVVPTLVHGDQVVTDSVRILSYLDEKFGGAALTPAGSDDTARMRYWIERQDGLALREISYSSFSGALGLVLRDVSMPLRLRKLRRLRDTVPDLAGCYEEKIQDVLRWRAAIAQREEISERREQLGSVLTELEAQLARTRFIAGEDYSLADVVWTCVLARLRMLGLAGSLWGDDRLPSIHAYYDRVRERPSFKRARLWETMPFDRLRSELSRRLRLHRK